MQEMWQEVPFAPSSLALCTDSKYNLERFAFETNDTNSNTNDYFDMQNCYVQSVLDLFVGFPGNLGFNSNSIDF